MLFYGANRNFNPLCCFKIYKSFLSVLTLIFICQDSLFSKFGDGVFSMVTPTQSFSITFKDYFKHPETLNKKIDNPPL